MQVFLRWEIDVFLNYLNGDLFKFQKVCAALNDFVASKHSITVNEFRAALAKLLPDVDISAHPDSRGNALIFADDIINEGDDVIPMEKLFEARASLIIKDVRDNSGRTTPEQYQEKYFRLVSETNAAGFAQWWAAQQQQ